MAVEARTRWVALIVLCLGSLMIGQRRLFLYGLALFTVASLACGLTQSQGELVAARVIQGFGGAVVSAVALSLMMSLFVERAERAKAMGVFGFVAAGGGTLGVLLGGILTDLVNWHWIFLVNVPIGIAVCALSLKVLPAGRPDGAAGRLDVWGAVSVTAALMLAVYAIVNGNQAGWTAKRRRSGWRSAERARWAMSSTVTGERRLYRGLAAPSHMRNDASATPRTDGSATAVRSCAKH
jgi:MFS family permease